LGEHFETVGLWQKAAHKKQKSPGAVAEKTAKNSRWDFPFGE